MRSNGKVRHPNKDKLAEVHDQLVAAIEDLVLERTGDGSWRPHSASTPTQRPTSCSS